MRGMRPQSPVPGAMGRVLRAALLACVCASALQCAAGLDASLGAARSRAGAARLRGRGGAAAALPAAARGHKRLALRGGGVPPPVIPLVLAIGGGSAALTLNADLRGRVLTLLQNVRKKLPGGKGRSPRAKVVIPEGYDVRNGTWAYEVNELSPGCLLVASPDTFRFAGPRQVLDQSVILLVRHGKSGSSGFIINRPTQFDVGDVTKKLAAFEQNPLYLGGDIGEGVYMIHGIPGLRNATEVSDGIYYGGSEHAMSLVQDGKAKPEDFRFFFKYAAWAPGQLEGEMESGCWCAVRSSLDLVLKPRTYPGLHFAKAHKVFWHQVLQTLGGRFQNVSRDTIIKEETERMKMEEWVAILQDGGNTSVLNHEGIEMGAMAMSTVTSQLTQADLEAVHDSVLAMTDKVKAVLPAGDESTSTQRLQTLSDVFFKDYTLAGPEDEIANANKDPAEALMVNNVVASKKGSALALSFLYIASARQLGVPLRALNCSARMKVPVEFVLRHDAADAEGADEQAIFVDLAQKGKILGIEDVPVDTHMEGTKGPVPHVQLYSRVMHKLADGYARVGQEDQVLIWLQQIRILQAAINTVAIMQAQAAAQSEQADASGNGAAAGEPQEPAKLHDILKGELVAADGSKTNAEALKGKVVAIYFSAGWCQPCKAFTPQLIQVYSKLKIADGKDFEIVLVSADRSQEAFTDYFGKMPWLAVDFADAETRSSLSAACGVQGIPMLAIFNEQGQVSLFHLSLSLPLSLLSSLSLSLSLFVRVGLHTVTSSWRNIMLPPHDARRSHTHTKRKQYLT